MTCWHLSDFTLTKAELNYEQLAWGARATGSNLKPRGSLLAILGWGWDD